MKILYKKDSKEKLRILKIYTKDDSLIQESGLAGGKLVVAKKTCKGKNLGKSNETSPKQQAILEMNSKITEKLKTDYFETEEEAMNSLILLPMLAKEYLKEQKKIDWTKDVFIQPKMDGMRCFTTVNKGKVVLKSRENTNILEEYKNSVVHLVQGFSNLPDGTYDGELYAHGYSFQENMELIKKYRPKESEDIKFHVYDFVSEDSYSNRRKHIEKASKLNKDIVLVRTERLYSPKDIAKYHTIFVSEGFEGSIIRHGEKGYELNKRSSYLLKNKDFIDLAAKIIDVVPMEARPSQGKLICKFPGGQFTANLKFSHKVREDILKNKNQYIGKTAEVRFFEYTDDGLPRFPVCVGFRLDK